MPGFSADWSAHGTNDKIDSRKNLFSAQVLKILFDLNETRILFIFRVARNIFSRPENIRSLYKTVSLHYATPRSPAAWSVFNEIFM